MSSIPRRYLPLALIPCVVFFLHFLLAGLAGPRYLHPKSDPQYIYLLNSLAVATGSYPGHMDHPGATAQALGAAALWAGAAKARADGLEAQVLGDPERAGRWVAMFYTAVACAFLFLAGLVIAGSHGFSVADALFFQLWPFTFGPVWSYSSMIAPDFFLLCLAQLASALYLCKEPGRKLSVQQGLLLGAMLVTKVTALAFLSGPLLFLRRKVSLAVLAYVLTGVVFFAFIAALYRSQLKYFLAYELRWFWQLATRKGWYGSGEAGLPGPGLLLQNLGTIAWELPLFVLTVLLCLACSRRMLAGDNRGRWLLFLTIAVGQLALVSKAAAAHYAFPGIPAAGALVLLVKRSILREMPKWLAPAALGGIVLLAVLSLVGTARSHQKFAAETSAVAVPADTQGNHVCSVLGSGLTCALQLGNNFVRGDFSPILHRLHPGHLLWRGEEAGELENFAREKVSLSSLMMKHGSVYFHGVNAMAEGKAPAKPALTKFEPLSTRDSGNSLWKASH